MNSDSSAAKPPITSPTTLTNHQTPHSISKPPLSILEGVFAFPPNRETLGGSAYFIVEKVGNILVDCPAWNHTNHQFILDQGGVNFLFITHRNAIARVKEIQQNLQCEVIIQEQEAYLLPEVSTKNFKEELSLSPHCTAIWTPGYSPGSSCLYYASQGGILFTGRHLLPNQEGKPMPLRVAKTFHWFRQLRSIEKLQARFTPQTLHYLCPGANRGFLRGKGCLEDAYDHLCALDLDQLRQKSVF